MIYAIKFRWERLAHVLIVAGEDEATAMQNFDLKMRESKQTEEYEILRVYHITLDELLQGEVLIVP